jgi:hypothetical protein
LLPRKEEDSVMYVEGKMDDDEKEALGDWLLDAAIRKISLKMIAAVEASINEEDEHYEQIMRDLEDVSSKMRLLAAMTLLVTVVMLSDDPAEVLNKVRPMLIDRPKPPGITTDD